MKWVIIILVVIVALIAILYLIGYFMPVKHIASAQRTFSKSTPAQVWRSITTFSEYTLWRSGLKKVEVVDDKNWKETSGGDTIHFYGETVEPEKHFVTRIMNKDLPYGGSWTYKIRYVANGTVLTITEDGEVYNPIFRFMSKYIFGHDGTIKKYLDDLDKHLNKV